MGSTAFTFNSLGLDFLNEFQAHASVTKIKAKTEILIEGQRIKYVCFLIKGSVKSYSLHDGKELTHYDMMPYDFCPETFFSIFNNAVSKVNLVATENSEIALIPVLTVRNWLIQYPEINQFFYNESCKHIIHLMDRINNIKFYSIDKRVINYIRYQISATGNNPVKLTHKEIAGNIGTSREVVSKILKKIESQGEITRTKAGIQLMNML
ncbi:Crp/Fnr family transcriptional regulator [Chryseobacterium sp. Tr-659]|uniref:Crp/Fnr family transcriptional regulator n=1 Tax=Chryseobacterium sp. Tr-659 TaxID=2608340 RepID=UPI001422A014|nr:Crp/Fnr family transcriptional regulator [Chryseobacterium sp. Tr-659]NIF06677.1 Crp/Fnr family transcriptional regulator [Chryseobacterium sp. Tr-659]